MIILVTRHQPDKKIVEGIEQQKDFRKLQINNILGRN